MNQQNQFRQYGMFQPYGGWYGQAPPNINIQVPKSDTEEVVKATTTEGFDSAVDTREYSRYPAGVNPGTAIMGALSPTVNTGDFEVDNPNYIRRTALWDPTDQNVYNQQVWSQKPFN